MSFYLLLLQFLTGGYSDCEELFASRTAIPTTEKVQMVKQPFHDTPAIEATAVLHKKPKPTIRTIQSISICKGEGYFTGGKPRFVSGVFSDTLITLGGRDSVIITQLSVLQCGFSD